MTFDPKTAIRAHPWFPRFAWRSPSLENACLYLADHVLWPGLEAVLDKILNSGDAGETSYPLEGGPRVWVDFIGPNGPQREDFMVGWFRRAGTQKPVIFYVGKKKP